MVLWPEQMRVIAGLSPITLETLQKVHNDQFHEAFRKYRADDVIGMFDLQGSILTPEDEKAILIQALMENYG